jgi:hypothetical protein
MFQLVWNIETRSMCKLIYNICKRYTYIGSSHDAAGMTEADIIAMTVAADHQVQ